LPGVHLAICERLKCEAKEQLEARLQEMDPDNGFVWAADLEHAQSSGSAVAVTAAIARIGAGPRMTFYWNQLEVMMVDALAVANPSQNLGTRGTVAIGVLAAQAIPALQPMSKACRLEQLNLPGRRAACEALVARMEQSSTVLTQSLAISMQERWWPAGSPQREVVRAKRRRLDYLITMSSRIRWWRMNRDMAVRIDAARKTDRQEDVELAMIKSFGLPPEPPRWTGRTPCIRGSGSLAPRNMPAPGCCRSPRPGSGWVSSGFERIRPEAEVQLAEMSAGKRPFPTCCLA
jgi:hypothetical protein